MKTSTVMTLLSAAASLVSSAPVNSTSPPHLNSTHHELHTSLRNFYLVTTSSASASSNSSDLPNVSATSLFDPYDQATTYLRQIGPGYLSLPTFNLTHGTLHTGAPGTENQGYYIYNSTAVESGFELGFVTSDQGQGPLALHGGYLLTVDGQSVGWSVCQGDLGQDVIVWQGTDSSCEATYLQAVSEPPY